MKRRALCLFLVLAACKPGNLLGPSDRPEFEKFDWTSGKVHYAINTQARGEIPREVNLDPREMREWFSKLSIEAVSGMSVGVPAMGYLTSGSHGSWEINLSAQSHMIFTSTEDRSRVYVVDLQNTAFSTWIVDRFAADALKDFPKSSSRNISAFSSSDYSSPLEE